jgi:hypothetical protein
VAGFLQNASQARGLLDLLAGGPGRRRTERLTQYQTLLRQLPTTAAGALGPLLTSTSEADAGAGRGLLGEYLRRRSPESRTGLEQQAATLEASRNEETRAAQRQPGLMLADRLGIAGARQSLERGRQALAEGPLRLRMLREQLTGQRLSNEGALLGNQAARLGLAAPQPALPYGEPPKGYFPVQSPSGQVEYIPQPGTAPFNDAQAGRDELENIVRDVQAFQLEMESAGPTGTEYVGPKATRLKFLRGNVLARVAKLRALGVLQPTELENLEGQLPDPTAFSANVGAMLSGLDPTGAAMDYRRAVLQAPYEAMREAFEEKLRQHSATYWYTRGNPSLLPEGAGGGSGQW